METNPSNRLKSSARFASFPRFAAFPYFPAFVCLVALACFAGLDARAADAPPKAPYEVHRDLEYVPGGGASQSLDLYLPTESKEADAKPVPLIVYIHGGGWEGGDKRGCWPAPFVAKGYAAASINYRLTDKATFPAQIQDCQAALRYLRANAARYKIDPNRIGVWGDSAGGHLVALLGVVGGKKVFPPIGGNEDQSDAVQAVCDFYGPSDLLTIYDQANAAGHPHPENPKSPISKLLGGSIADHKKLAEAASPVHYVAKGCPPFLIVHGTKDPLVPIAQSQELADALKKAGDDVTFDPIEGAGHGNGIVGRPGWLKQVLGFFDKQLKK